METMEQQETNDQEEPYFMRMTPMEVDMQLQVAEMIFRSLLEGRRLPVTDHPDIESWEKDTLPKEWCDANNAQRKEIVKQVRADGENSPIWMECLAHMGDIAWEVLEAGSQGERIRELDTIDRVEVVEQFKDLRTKVEVSYFARCGAADRLYGLRACVAIFRTFIRDPDILKLMVTTLTWIITDHERNRDCLACITVPAPPMERSKTSKDKGWSFLRNALDAFIVQAGGTGYDESESDNHPSHSHSKDVALIIAKLLLRAKDAPAAKVQIVIAQEDPPEGCWVERKELRAIIPRALERCEALIQASTDPKETIVWNELRNMLSKKPSAS